MLISLLCLFISFFLSCTLNDAQLKKSWWKYNRGYYLGDVLDFKDLNYRNDTIFVGKKPIAIILFKQKALPGGDNQITIKSLSTKETGIYDQK